MDKPQPKAPVVMGRLWAPMIQPTKGKPYFSWPDVRLSRKDARAAFLGDLPKELHRAHLRRVKFVRVYIAEGTPPTNTGGGA